MAASASRKKSILSDSFTVTLLAIEGLLAQAHHAVRRGQHHIEQRIVDSAGNSTTIRLSYHVREGVIDGWLGSGNADETTPNAATAHSRSNAHMPRVGKAMAASASRKKSILSDDEISGTIWFGFPAGGSAPVGHEHR